MDNVWERIYDYVRIDFETAKRLFAGFDAGCTVAGIELFSGGRSTTNYKISLNESSQKFVLRIYPNDDESWLKEQTVLNTLKYYLPVPEMYYLNTEKRIIDRPFALVKYLDGVTLDQYLKGTGGISESLAQKIGETLAEIHKQKEYVKEGVLDVNLNIIESDLPIMAWHESLLNGRAGERLDGGVRNRLIKFLKENHELLERMARYFVFSQGDFRPANLMVKDGNLVGILDWEGALSAPPYFDIGQFTRYQEQISGKARESFISGYDRNSRHPVGADWEKPARLMDLVNLLVFLNNEQEKPNLFGDMKNLVERTLAILEK